MADYTLIDGPFRYVTARSWDDSAGTICFIGFNPSPTDGAPNDPLTIKAFTIALRLGYGGFLLMNEWAFCAPLPRDAVQEQCREGGDAKGPTNDAYLQGLAGGCQAVVACWGANGHAGQFEARHRELIAMFPNSLRCFGKITPLHPRSLDYLRGDETLVPF